MLRVKIYANKLQKFIEEIMSTTGVGIKYKIYIRLDFSLEARLFIDTKSLPQENLPEYLQEEGEEAFQEEFELFLKREIAVRDDVEAESGQHHIPDEGILKNDSDDVFVPEIRLTIDSWDEASNVLNVHLFSEGKGNDIEFGNKYRFGSLLDEPVKRIKKDSKKRVPVVTFYSYKGGMGRTTTLIGYAIYLASKGKKVAVVDCDLEAPGYLNFFDLSNQQELKEGRRNGLVEYFSDYSFVEGKDDYLNISDYLIIPDKFMKNTLDDKLVGNIFIIPGGNLNDTGEEMDVAVRQRLASNGRDYLEGISRLNISNQKATKQAFNSIFSKLRKLGVDVILVDSRTGFNDIFGVLALSMSDHVVGFFGYSDQTIPGYRQLLLSYLNPQTDFNFDIVTSLIPKDADEKWIQRGHDKLMDIWRCMANEDEGKKTPGHYILRRLSILERLGTGDVEADSRFNTIAYNLGRNQETESIEKELGDIKKLYEDLSMAVGFEENDIKNEILKLSESGNNTLERKTQTSRDAAQNVKVTPIKRQKAILKHTQNQFAKIKLFAEDTDIRKDIFFFRRWMVDFFDQSKFIILGSKGSGKSMLYRALGEERYLETANLIMETAKKIVLKEKLDFEFPANESFIYLNVISLQRELDLNGLLAQIQPSNLSYFWMAYTWNAIMTNKTLLADGVFWESVISKSNITDHIVPPELIRQESYTAALKLIELSKGDFLFLGQVEKDFIRINDYLVATGKRLLLLYDGLDNINPRTWGKNISPLIEFWRDKTNKYSNISPKLFIRTDLYTNVEGTNTQRLELGTINIDWSLEEVFGYFFKIIFSKQNIRDYFWDILKEQGLATHVETIEKSWNDEANQLLKPSVAVLKPLVRIFFGEKVEEAKNMDSWDFFKTSLSNANGSISLRPFINLLNENVIQLAYADANQVIKAILPSKYYATQENREKAANNYFMDMAKGDDFTADILKFQEYLRSAKGEKYRYKELDETDFDSLLSAILLEYQNEDLISKSILDLKNQLKAAGIVVEVPRGKKYFRFASMYDYIWGLKNPEVWETGVLDYGKDKHMSYVIKSSKGISYYFKNRKTIPGSLTVGDRIEYRLLETAPRVFRVVQWRVPKRWKE